MKNNSTELFGIKYTTPQGVFYQLYCDQGRCYDEAKQERRGWCPEDGELKIEFFSIEAQLDSVELEMYYDSSDPETWP